MDKFAENHQNRLKSCHPLSVTHHANQQVSSVSPQETVKCWIFERSKVDRVAGIHHHGTSPVHAHTSRQGVGLPRRAWTRLNMLQTLVGKFSTNMLCWDLSKSDSCNCGPDQTADDTISGGCPSSVHHHIILSTQCVVAILWSVVQLRRGRLRMVVYVMGSC